MNLCLNINIYRSNIVYKRFIFKIIYNNTNDFDCLIKYYKK